MSALLMLYVCVLECEYIRENDLLLSIWYGRIFFVGWIDMSIYTYPYVYVYGNQWLVPCCPITKLKHTVYASYPLNYDAVTFYLQMSS